MSDIERLVEEVTRQVRDRLNVVQPSTGGSCSGGQCHATARECDGSGHCHVRKEPVIRAMRDLGAVRFSASPGAGKPDPEIARHIDHTLLKPEATREELRKLSEEAKQYGFYSVCVNAANIPYVARILSGSQVKPIAVVGFPLGAMTPSAKAFEAREAVRNGAKEIDMVINIGALKSRDYATVLEDIRAVTEASRPSPVKVILETASLTHDEKVAGCVLSKAAGAAFVKTSTGFGPGGATVEDVELMRRIVGEDMGVKASGGVRTTEDVKAMFKAGADRIGASASIAIVTGGKAKGGY